MTIVSTLKQEQVKHLNLHEFTAIGTGATVRATIAKMRAENQHCAIVLNQKQLVGIFTDRDILRKVVTDPATWDKPVDAVMTRQPITVTHTEQADTALALMDEKHFRNIPVLDDRGEVVGNLTHYAIVKYLADRFPESVYNLPPDPDPVMQRRDGA